MCEKRRIDLMVLGPLALAVDGQDVPLGSVMRQRLLGALASHANNPVPISRLADTLWDEPPASAGDNLRQYVYRLRKDLGPGERITRDRGGYRLTLLDGELDAQRFETRLSEADQALAQGDPGLAQDLLTEALDLWRGPAYGDLAEVPLVRQAAVRLEEGRLLAIEQWVEAGLRLGRHDRLIPRLAALVAEHPMRDRLRGQWMLALYRAGREADALAVFRQGRQIFVEELGLEPGAELQRLEQSILTHDPSLDLRQPSPVRSELIPAELPPGPGACRERADEIVRLRDALTPDGSMAIAAISGPPGVGKSALAIHVGHQLAADYPDGQLYVNLHGSTPDADPLEPAEILARFLRSLGAQDSAIPADVDEAGCMFRSRTAGRRLLLVLDDALDIAQVRPLLPSGPECGVLVTSRRTLSDLEAAAHLRLGVLPQDEAISLLARLAGAKRVEAEPEAAADVVRRCGRLPLAISIAAARLSARPAWTLAKLARRLDGEADRLSELETDDRGIRASFLVSYRQLDAEHRRLFRLMSLLNGPDAGVAAAAALAGISLADAETRLDHLVGMQLVENPVADRYRMDDLMRLFARELAEGDEWRACTPIRPRLAAPARRTARTDPRPPVVA